MSRAADMRPPVIPGPSLLNALPGPAAVLDRYGVVVTVNEAWLDFGRQNGDGVDSGVGRSYLRACAAGAALGAPGAAEAEAAISAALEGRRAAPAVTYPCHEDDQPRWFEFHVAPLRLPSGQGALVLHLAVTADSPRPAGPVLRASENGASENGAADKRAGENGPDPALLLGSLGQAVIWTDLKGAVRYWNAAAEQLYGWTAGEAIGRDIAELTVPQLTQEMAAGIMQTLRDGGQWSGAFIV